jgi:hypothetical protein
MYSGITRARISSQCLKRAIRLHAKELCPDLYAARLGMVRSYRQRIIDIVPKGTEGSSVENEF